MTYNVLSGTLSLYTTTTTTTMCTVCVTSATISDATSQSRVATCNATNDAYPSASYRWTNHVDGSQSTGQQYVLQPDTQYELTCSASNNLERCLYATDYVEVNSKLLLPSLCFPFYDYCYDTCIAFSFKITHYTVVAYLIEDVC